ncbi:MAG: Tm-1-like ATP-binding domain-containing protein [Thermodesulfobacteriota bacterium]
MRAPTIGVIGTFDSKGEEHLFLKRAIEARGLEAYTINLGTKGPAPFTPDLDIGAMVGKGKDRDQALTEVLDAAKVVVGRLYAEGKISALISAGGGSGTYLATTVMKVLPFGVPKVMVSTVASRDMSWTVGTHDITMIHSVADLLGVNSVSGVILDQAAGAVCGMVQRMWVPQSGKRRVALTMFGFVTQAAEAIKGRLEDLGYEVIAFHANGTGGTAMEELAAAGHFEGILDLALHELADRMMGGYCGGIGSERLEPIRESRVPRLVVPGGLDCAVLEFTREGVPERYRDRKIFFYDFRSAIRLSVEESLSLAREIVEKLNRHTSPVCVLVPKGGWSEADRPGGPLHAPEVSVAFMKALREGLRPDIPVREVKEHINEPSFARVAASMMDEMISGEKE